MYFFSLTNVRTLSPPAIDQSYLLGLGHWGYRVKRGECVPVERERKGNNMSEGEERKRGRQEEDRGVDRTMPIPVFPQCGNVSLPIKSIK